jgi:hypothetical protein
MGGSKPPEVVHPGEAAQAAMGTAAAGEMMSLANQPVDQYGNLINTMALGPAAMQTQQSLAGRAARQGAQQQMEIQSSVDPQAYAQRQMRMNAANQQLGKLYNVDPTAFAYNAPSNTYAVPGTGDLPDPVALSRNARALAANLSVGAVNKSGTDPVLHPPSNVQGLPYALQTSYLPAPTTPAK